MKITLQPPPIVLELDVDEEKANQLAKEFSIWLARYLPSWGWRKFAKRSCPELLDTSKVQFENVREGDSWVMLKPHSGEQVSDLLRHVARAGFKREAAQLKEIMEQYAPKIPIRSLLQYALTANVPWADVVKQVANFNAPAEMGYQWEKRGNQRFVRRGGDGDVALVLNIAGGGGWFGQILDKRGKQYDLKLIKGPAANASGKAYDTQVVLPGDSVMLRHRYSYHDDSISQTLNTAATVKAKVLKIDPSRGLLVDGKDPNKQKFRYWADLGQALSKV